MADMQKPKKGFQRELEANVQEIKLHPTPKEFLFFLQNYSPLSLLREEKGTLRA